MHCFHIFCLPLFESHLSQLMFDVFKKAMEALRYAWPDALFAACTDGARNMTGRISGIISRVENCVDDA